MSYRYAQIVGGEEDWQCIPGNLKEQFVTANNPMFITVLAVSKIVDPEMDKSALEELKYAGPLYFDWDSEDVSLAASNAVKLLRNLEEKGVDLGTLRIYATGGRGFHVEVPEVIFQAKPGWHQFLPAIYKELAFTFAVDTLDLRVYTARRGRMWRQPNVQRPNGKYKVQISWQEMQEMTPELYDLLCSRPRPELATLPAKPVMAMQVEFDKAMQKVESKVAKRKKSKPTPPQFAKDAPSLVALCEGRGIKPGTGFNKLSLQLAIIAHALEWSEETLVQKCQGLIIAHESDGTRYNTRRKREDDLRRMWQYTEGNPCYEFSVGALKELLVHSAPDLSGRPVAEEEIEAAITAAENGEIADLAEDDNAVVLLPNGVYAATENGLKRICAIAFENVAIMYSLETGDAISLQSDLVVGGHALSRVTLLRRDLLSVQALNSIISTVGYTFQGSEQQVRGLFMRMFEKARKSNNMHYITAKEGVDFVAMRDPATGQMSKKFLIYADASGVIAAPEAEEELKASLKFQGFPDVRGQYHTDLSTTPQVKEWMASPENEKKLLDCIDGMVNCQNPEFVGKLVGWMVSAFYKQLFQAQYGKFPLLHIAGPQGSGKTETTLTLLHFHYWRADPKTTSPASTQFALQYAASGSASIPMVVDEYKPHEMRDGVHNQMKAMFREAYNGKTVARGGGNQNSDDYRALHETTLSAPIVFIAEAQEEESAVMERVVLAGFPQCSVHQQRLNRNAKEKMAANREALSILGGFIARRVVRGYSQEALKAEFDVVYEAAREAYLVVKEGDSEDVVQAKALVRERTLYNYVVAEFGVRKFHALVSHLLGDKLPESVKEKLEAMCVQIYGKMADVQTATQAEWLKVFNGFSEMTYLDDILPYALKKGADYAFVDYGGRSCVEVALRRCYAKYRQYNRTIGSKPLFAGEQAFMSSMRDCPALVANVSQKLGGVANQSAIFNIEELNRRGFLGFKD